MNFFGLQSGSSQKVEDHRLNNELKCSKSGGLISKKSLEKSPA